MLVINQPQRFLLGGGVKATEIPTFIYLIHNLGRFSHYHNFKTILRSKLSSPEISTVSLRSDVEFDHDVVLVGNDLSTSSASLSMSLSTLSSGESSITIGGSTATFAYVTLLSDERTSNGKTVLTLYLLYEHIVAIMVYR